MASKAARTTRKPRADGSITMRVTAETRRLIDSAAAALGTTRTQFMIDSARARAEDVVLDQRLLVLGEDDWAAFQEAMTNPPPPNEKLRALLATKPPWE